MELEVEGRRPVGRPKKTWSKVVLEDIRKLNIAEDMAAKGGDLTKCASLTAK